MDAQHLVILSHTMDDIPVRLFTEYSQAAEFAAEMDWDVPARVLNKFDWPNCSTPCCISIATFRNGVPFSRTIVREFEEEE
jgi:hypothetical protein